MITHFGVYVDPDQHCLHTSGAKGKIAKAALARLEKADPPLQSAVPDIALGELMLLGDVTGGGSEVSRVVDPEGQRTSRPLTHDRLILLYEEAPEASAFAFVRTMQKAIDDVLSST